MAQILLNNVTTKLTAAITNVATTLNVTTGTGSLFAGATGGNYIVATLVKVSGFKEVAWEIVWVTAQSGDVLTVTRAQESTTALTFSIGDVLDVRFTAGLVFPFTNATTLLGKTWASPDPIGATTRSSGLFTTLGANALMTAGAGIAVTGGPQTPGVISRTANVGMLIGAFTGSVYDFAILNTANTLSIMYVPTGTNNVGFANNVVAAGTITSTGQFIGAAGYVDQAYSVQTPTTGFSITIAAGIQTLALVPAGTLATGTITMPAAPVNGQIERISTSQTITALTVSANAGQTILNPPTTLTAGTGAEWIYQTANTRWIRLR